VAAFAVPIVFDLDPVLVHMLVKVLHAVAHVFLCVLHMLAMFLAVRVLARVGFVAVLFHLRFPLSNLRSALASILRSSLFEIRPVCSISEARAFALAA
jgi:hypothetical protein